MRYDHAADFFLAAVPLTLLRAGAGLGERLVALEGDKAPAMPLQLRSATGERSTADKDSEKCDDSAAGDGF